MAEESPAGAKEQPSEDNAQQSQGQTPATQKANTGSHEQSSSAGEDAKKPKSNGASGGGGGGDGDGDGDGKGEEGQGDDAAARLIQRNFRGYRTRRELEGMGLDANTRWGEAFKSLQLDNARDQQSGKKGASGEGAAGKWKRGGLLVGQIAGSPGNAKEDGSNPASGSMSDGPVPGGPSLHERGEEGNDKQDGLPGGGKPEKDDSDGKLGDVPGAYDHDKIDNVHRIAKPNQKGLRMIEWWTRGAAAQDLSKTMEATYWLEMVDRKHRYGSNLKPYHAEWSKSDTKDNFFVWLDEGEGKDLDLPDCSREQLEKECIEYLSADQRMNYVVDIKDGKLHWRWNGKPIDTAKNKHRDLGHGRGIVELGPEEQEELSRLKEERRQQAASDDSSSFSGSSSSSDPSDPEEAEEVEKAAQHYGGEKPKKHRHLGMLSSKGFMDALLRKTVQANTWIYVLNSRRELYVGIKQTGKFQHSSFLYGGRVLSAGLLKVNNGTLTSLSPLSGHYRAGTAHFRHFVWLLQQEGVDLNQVTLSKSLLMLRGMEAYGKLKSGKKKKKKSDKKDKEGKGEEGDKPDEKDGTRQEEKSGPGAVASAEGGQEDKVQRKERINQMLGRSGGADGGQTSSQAQGDAGAERSAPTQDGKQVDGTAGPSASTSSQQPTSASNPSAAAGASEEGQTTATSNGSSEQSSFPAPSSAPAAASKPSTDQAQADDDTSTKDDTRTDSATTSSSSHFGSKPRTLLTRIREGTFASSKG